MNKNEEAVIVRLLRRMNEMQLQIQKPTVDDATDEEVRTLLKIFWKWTPHPRYDLPSKHTIEKLVGWLRGCQDGAYCYVSRCDVARIIRDSSKSYNNILSPVILNKGADKMTDSELYDHGKWNYAPTPLVNLVFNVYVNSNIFDRDGNRW